MASDLLVFGTEVVWKSMGGWNGLGYLLHVVGVTTSLVVVLHDVLVTTFEVDAVDCLFFLCASI